jgi:hypothetical protein
MTTIRILPATLPRTSVALHYAVCISIFNTDILAHGIIQILNDIASVVVLVFYSVQKPFIGSFGLLLGFVVITALEAIQ